MLRVSIIACGIVLAVAPFGVAQQSTTGSSTEAHIRYPECLVKLIDRFDVQVSAQEAGVLQSLEAHEGMEVQAGTLLGQIDDSQRKARRRSPSPSTRSPRPKPKTTSTFASTRPSRAWPKWNSV